MIHNYPTRFLATTALTSLLLLGLCIAVAYVLLDQQNVTAAILDEDVDSRRAAVNLEESLTDLIALHKDKEQPEGVGPIQKRIQETHLPLIEQYSNKEAEKQHAARVASSFQAYLDYWHHPTGESRHKISEETISRLDRVWDECRKLREYNAQQIEESERIHQRSLRWMAWGLTGVGGLGSMAGLILGYGVARGLRRSIHQLRVRVQDAADKLGQELPPVVLTGADLDPLAAHLQQLVVQIEQVVQKLQQREREVRRSEQLAAVGQLAAGVAHEIRNPLTSIKILIQAGREDLEAHGFPDEDLQVIEDEIRRMERTLRTFLDFARPPRLERAPLDLVPLVQRTLRLVAGRAERQGVAVSFHHPADPVPIDADAEQLQQVLVNLALNALDVMPHGGSLEVSLWTPHDGLVELSVRDTGQGITPELIPRLFQPFVSTKDTGLGMGLVVSRRIVEDHGGTLQALNRPEGGACFLCRLPRHG
jgi:signal transduction histidine kinase